MNTQIEKLLEHVKVNDKIQELAEQSGCNIDRLGYGEGNLEKFAELIVKECAYLVNDYQRTTGYTDYARMLCKTFDIEFKEQDFWGRQ